MRPFVYERAADEAAVTAAAARPGTRLLAGGTGLVDLMRLGVEAPERVVDVGGLAWATIDAAEDGGLRVGALVRNSDLAWHPAVRERYPALSEALLSGASPQLRNMATVGGNLMQRTRCAYFRDVGFSACNRRAPGSGCAALEGFNRMHAILGTSDACIAAHPSDMCVAMAALDAVVHVRGPGGERSLPVTSLHARPGAHPEVEHTLAQGEVVTHVTLPASPRAARSVYVKVRDRASFAFALASAAVAVEVKDGAVTSARVALGGVGTVPWRSPEAEAALAGRPATRDAFRAAAEAALAGARPRTGNAFKVELAKRTLVRALERATGAS